MASILLIASSLNSVNAAPLDDFGPPPATDPSAFNNPPDDPKAALEALKTLPQANQGALALPNGVFGDRNTPRADNVLPTFRTGDRVDDNQGDNKKPLANPDSAVSNNGQPLVINVLANDTDPDGNLPLKVVDLTQPDSGQGTTSTDGVRVTYTPPLSFPAPFTATFTYNASDAKDAVSEKPATVSVAVSAAAVNEELLVSSATVTARSNNRYTWDLAGTTSQAAGNTISVTASTTGGPVSLGTATLSPTASGARWRVSVTTTGNAPTASPTVTVSSSLGTKVTAPVGVR